MIRLNNLNKYFNKNKHNQIHVINNTNLDFPSKGLVCLLGASGSGKTTLLNVIGGLDKAKGEIIYDDITIKRYNMKKVDLMRRKYMGYIFQNYNLFPDMTVYDNLKFALSLAHIYDKDEIDKRINYCLNAVGMINYKKRKASALSGGQQQRVAIARALVKKSRVIIADEPTGNLDSNNTIEVMNIIKKISETCLVILVTHERKIASFYGDRIIELSDGKVVNDYINNNSDTYKHEDNKTIYLKDLNNKNYQHEDFNLDLYYEDAIKDKFEIKVVLKDGSIIVEVQADTKVKYITPNSELILKDEHYQEIKKTDYQTYQYDNSFFSDKRGRNNHLKELFNDFKVAFSNFYFVKFRYKIMYFGFFLVGLIIAYTVANVSNIFYFNEKQYIKNDRSVITLNNSNKVLIDIDDLLEQGHVMDVSYNDYSYNAMNIDISNSFQTVAAEFRLQDSKYLLNAKNLNEDDLLMGKLPSKYNEIALDAWLCDSLFQQPNGVGITKYEQLIGRKLDLNTDMLYVISGILNRKAYVIALNNTGYINESLKDKQARLNGVLYQTFEENQQLVIVEGVLPTNANEILINTNYNKEVKIGDVIDSLGLSNNRLNKSYTVVGRFDSNNDNVIFAYITNVEAVSRLKTVISQNETLNIFSSNKIETLEYLASKGFEAEDNNQELKNDYIENQLKNLLNSIIFVSVLSGGILIYIYFMMRSKMINRIYTIGVYRALGASRVKVLGLFLMELFVLTTFTSIVGYSLMVYFINYFNSMLKGMMLLFYFPWYNMVLGILIIYVLNILFGLLPIILLLRKTPSQILSKYDI